MTGLRNAFLCLLAAFALAALALAGLAAFVIAAPLTLVVAISWIAFRPLIGGGLLVVAAAPLYGLRRWHRSRHPVTPAPAAAPTA